MYSDDSGAVARARPIGVEPDDKLCLTMSRAGRLVAALLAEGLVFGGLTASAHQLSPEVVAYLAVNGADLRVLVRVPTGLLADVRLPVIPPGFLDLSNLDEPLKLVAEEVVRSLDLTDDGRPLPPPIASAWRITPQTDRSFDTAGRAAALVLSSPVPPDTRLYWNETFVDLQFEIRAPAAITRLGARLNGLGTPVEPGRTRAVYVPVSGAQRTYEIAGSPRHVEFEPSALDVITTEAGLAAVRIATDRLLLLFLLAVIVPLRSTSSCLRWLAPAAGVHLLTMLAVQLPGQPLSLPLTIATEVGAAVVLIGLAAMNVLDMQGARARLLGSGLFGAAHGLLVGAAVRETIAVAGSSPVTGLAVYEATLLLGSALLTAVLVRLVRVARLLPVSEWAVIVGLSALPAHEASHVVLDAGGRLAALDLDVASPALSMTVRYWPALALAAALLALAGAAARWRRTVSGGSLPEP